MACQLIPSPEAFPKVLLLQPWLGYRVSLPFTEPFSIISRTQIRNSESKQDCNYQEPYGDYFSLAHFVCQGSAIIDLSSERFWQSVKRSKSACIFPLWIIVPPNNRLFLLHWMSCADWSKSIVDYALGNGPSAVFSSLTDKLYFR